MKTRSPRGMALGLIIAGDLVLLLLGWFLLIAPQRSIAAGIARSAQSTEVQIQELQEEAAAAANPIVPKQPPIRTANLYELAKAMPVLPDMPDLLLEIDQIARDSGVTVGSITPSAESAGTGFSVLPITVSFTGDYYSLTDLIYRLDNLVTVRHGEIQATGRLFSVAEIALAPAGSNNSLQATVTVNAFVYGVSGAAPATTATPDTSTTSTDTTSSDTTATTTTSST